MRQSAARHVAAAAAATVALLLWGMAFWMLVYEHVGVYSTVLPGAAEATAALQSAGAQTGTYFWPWPRNTPQTMELFLEGHRQGPFFKISYVAEGIDPQNPIKMVWGSIHHFVVAGCAAGMLWLTGPLESAAHRFGLVMLAGFLGTIWAQIGDPIWYHLPWDFSVGIVVYDGVSWVLLAGILAAILGPTEPSADNGQSRV